MDLRKIKMKYLESSVTRRMVFSKGRATIIKKANALARLRNVKVAVLINSHAGRSYMYRSPGFNSVVVRRLSSSLKKARILKLQTKFDDIMRKLEAEKKRGKVLKKKLDETLEKYNIKDIEDSTLEELIAFKEKLEALRDNVMKRRMEMVTPYDPLKLSRDN